jgi:hypothetical protein
MTDLNNIHNDPEEEVLFSVREIAEAIASIKKTQEAATESIYEKIAQLEKIISNHQKQEVVRLPALIEERPRWRPAFISVITFSLLSLITLTALIYSLNNTYRLNLQWEKRAEDKMQEAINLDKIIQLFQQEEQNARKSH